jgi:hypothetical protein
MRPGEIDADTHAQGLMARRQAPDDEMNNPSTIPPNSAGGNETGRFGARPSTAIQKISHAL